MIINFHQDFAKSYSKLSHKLRQKVDIAIGRLRKDQRDVLLKNHALKGRMSGKRAISATGDMRIIFKEYGDYVLVMILDVGTHNQVYG